MGSPSLLASVTKFAEALGDVANNSILAATTITNQYTKTSNFQNDSQVIANNSNFGGLGGLKDNLPLENLIQVLEAGASQGTYEQLGIPKKEYLSVIERAKAEVERRKQEKEKSPTSKISADARIGNILSQAGLIDLDTAGAPNLKTGFAQLKSIDEVKRLLPTELSEAISKLGLKPSEESIDSAYQGNNRKRLGLSVQRANALLLRNSEQQELFDNFSPVSKARSNVQGLSGVREELENTLIQAKLANKLKPEALPDERLRAETQIQAATENLTKARNAEFEAIRSVSGAIHEETAARLASLSATSPLGQVNLAKAELEGASKEKAQAEKTLSLAKTTSEIAKATEDLTKARKDERDAIENLKESEISRLRTLRDSQFDPRTFQGQRGLIESGIEDAKARVNNAASEIDSLKKQLAGASTPDDKKNIQDKIERAKLEYNKGQIDISAGSAAAQNNTIALAEASNAVAETLFKYKQAVEAATDKTAQIADQSAALSEQLAKQQRDLKDFDADRKLRELGAQGNIVAAAEKAYRATQSNDGGLGDIGAQIGISSNIPGNLKRFVKGDFFFDQTARDRFESEQGVAELQKAIRENNLE